MDLKGVNLYLVGMMGAGKTSTGRLLAKHLGYQFFDTDVLVEQLTGQSITEIFAQLGESAFRQLETQVLAELSSYKKLVVATGGGIVLEQMNWSYLHHGIVVWLDVSVDQLWARLQLDNTRPLLQVSAPQTRLQTLQQERQRFYTQADVRISIQAETAEEVAAQVLREILKVLRPEVQSEQN